MLAFKIKKELMAITVTEVIDVAILGEQKHARRQGVSKEYEIYFS